MIIGEKKMFKINFDPQKEIKKKIINPEYLLPKQVETTDGIIRPFNANNIVDSLIKETNLDKRKAIEITTIVLRKLSSLGLDFIAAPHIRELICGELTAQGLHKYRCKYTRLGVPIYDVQQMLKTQTGSTFSSLLAAQVIEQYVHLDRLSEDAQAVIDEISNYANNTKEEDKKLILDCMENALRLYAEKKSKNLI